MFVTVDSAYLQMRDPMSMDVKCDRYGFVTAWCDWLFYSDHITLGNSS